MKRRNFLRLLGLAPITAAVPAALAAKPGSLIVEGSITTARLASVPIYADQIVAGTITTTAEIDAFAWPSNT